jgi:glutamate/tyrosine decarboxylase-like PLP-dependent enzyme
VVDPVVELAAVAREREIPLHVDACIGGFMLPFVRELGYQVPPFDLRVPGVTSLSADLHSYAYAATGASVILYREPQMRRQQYFVHTGWPGGLYASPTMAGTRPGGAIAAAWAIMHRLGRRGYLGIAKEVMEATRRIQAGVEEIDGLSVLGRPHMSLMALAAERVDIYEVGDRLGERGWHLERQQLPPSLHLTVNRAHVPSTGMFLEDLRQAVVAARKEPLHRLLDRSRLALAGTVSRVLPPALASRVGARAAQRLGAHGTLPALYGVMAALPDRGDLERVVLDVMDRLTRPDED